MNPFKILKKISNQRILVFTILFLILAGLCIYYNENFILHQEYSSLSAVKKNYNQGDLVVVSGSITQTSPNSFQLKDSYNTNFTIVSPQKVNTGDKAEVYGLIGTDSKITAEQINIVPLWSYQFIMARSFIAFLFLALIFIRYWKFNPKKGLFQRRIRKK